MQHSDLTDTKIQFRGLFTDFLKKALVVADHDILVYKLEHYDDTRTLKAVILHQNKSSIVLVIKILGSFGNKMAQNDRNLLHVNSFHTHAFK